MTLSTPQLLWSHRLLVVEVYSTLLLMNATIFVLGAEISQYDLRLNRIEYIPEPLKVHMIATLALPEYWYFPILSFNELSFLTPKISKGTNQPSRRPVVY